MSSTKRNVKGDDRNENPGHHNCTSGF